MAQALKTSSYSAYSTEFPGIRRGAEVDGKAQAYILRSLRRAAVHVWTKISRDDRDIIAEALHPALQIGNVEGYFCVMLIECFAVPRVPETEVGAECVHLRSDISRWAS